MNRRYSREYYRDLVLAVADKIPGVAIAADVMVGFPDEKETDFIATRDLLAELPVSSLHVFKYSVRPGTKAAMMGPAIEERIKNQRSEILLDLAAAKNHEFCQSMLGQNTEVLVQQKLNTGIYEGLTDNYLEIQFPAPEDLTGDLIRVTPQTIEEGIVKGIMTA